MARSRGMDLSKLQFALRSANATANDSLSLTELPTTILEALIPGYSLISRFALQAFGFDISIVVSLGLVLFVIFTASSYFRNHSSRLFFSHFSASVYIDEDDDLFASTMKWIAEQRMSQVARSIKAVTQHGAAHETETHFHTGAVDEEGLFNFGKWSAMLPPLYEPYFGIHHFWFKGRLFFFDRTRKENSVRMPWQSRADDEQKIQLTTIGRSTKPVKALIGHIKAWALEKEESVTVIRRPAAKDSRRGAGTWNRVTSRPSRPMDTVVLGTKQKQDLVNDINEFLHPSSPKWYATRGIPYRRGYLFHGPPGTGKSSLSFALAGLFGLDIYVVSLLEPTLTEGDLSHLFTNLPRRCIVLLEDIDTAGLNRDEKSDNDDEAAKKLKSESKNDSNVNSEVKEAATEITKAIRMATMASRRGMGMGMGMGMGKADEPKQGISLSGLLNAIDGVASHEGRVLVMTTNHPEKLDKALIRPGRVDMQVEFTLASKHQAREIFIRMYSDEDRKDTGGANHSLPVRNTATNVSKTHPPAAEKTSPAMNGVMNGHAASKPLPELNANLPPHLTSGKGALDTPPATPSDSKHPSTSASDVDEGEQTAPDNAMDPGLISASTPGPGPSPADLTFKELHAMADQFADMIPDATLSPAEVQNFLIARKKEPLRALNEVVSWQETVIQAREKGSKVVPVQ